jgi:segregation and condensation protein A
VSKPIVSLPVFEGPLDLLLQLIEQQQLDITTIALAQVADQYLRAVRSTGKRGPAELAEFLAIGARLILIKTRALLPRPPAEAPRLQEEDVGDQLARQLREYSRFKQLAATLKEREADGLRSYARVGPPPLLPRPPVETLAKLDVSLDELVKVVERRLQLLREDEPPVSVPRPKTLTIAEVAGNVRRRLAAQPWITFDDLLSLAVTRNELIVTLWTVLELFKRQAITIEQEALFEPITIGRGPAFGDEMVELEV